jgi:CubicO group peptidase (beta-lactamase class C family)
MASGVAPNASAGFVTPRGEVFVGGESELLFDLASVTKPIFAVAFARSGLDRQARLGSMLEAARGTAAEDAPLELMFAHRAGFPAHMRLWELPDPLVSACRSRSGPLPAPPLYSDIGYLLAGVAANAEALMTKHVIEPLGLSRILGSARAVGTGAPTEVTGHVHDENAWALGGLGACGHAGLFGTVEAVLAFGRSVLEDMGSLEWVLREREGGTLRAGFDGKSAEGSSAGSVLGPRSFGHLGFTGTSLWIDPDTRVVVALLTNRVAFGRDPEKIRAARPKVHDALARASVSSG